MIHSTIATSALWLLSCIAYASSSQCVDERGNGGGGECTCLDAVAFQRRVASYDTDASILPSLRGTINDLISQEDIDLLVDLLPMSEFTVALGYGDGDEGDTRDARAYNSPIAYTSLSLQELSVNEERYNKLLQIREKVRSSTELSLGLCPNTLLIDFTTVSQKIELGAHRAHADNCLHYFVDGKATCADTSREHPYPNRVADSGNFVDG